jgi:hypothetical protein
MVRQAKSYLVGAVSGAGLIAAALVAFVLLVSALVFEDLPVAGLVGGGNDPAVSPAQPAAPAAALAKATAAPTGAGAKAGGAGGGNAAKVGAGASGGPGTQGVEGGGQQSPGGGGGGEATGGSGGGGGGSALATGGSGGGGAVTSSSGGGGGGSTSGGEAGGGGATTTTSTSGKVTGTVNETVNQVDQTVTGGALEETGVTQTTEEVVNGVAGPESTVGKVVDGTVKTVEGILKPK